MTASHRALRAVVLNARQALVRELLRTPDAVRTWPEGDLFAQFGVR